MLHGNNSSQSDRLEAREWIVNDLINAFKAARPKLSRIRSIGFYETFDSEVKAHWNAIHDILFLGLTIGGF